MSCRAIIIACGVLLGMASASAQTDAPFQGRTLEAFLVRAQAENPGLQAFSLRYEVAMERIPQARVLPDPVFQVTHFVESVETRLGPQENAFVLSQRLPWFGKLSARESAASAEAQALWSSMQQAQLGLARQVAVAFYEYGYTAQALELAKENHGLLDNLLPVVEARVESGGPVNPLLRLQVEVARLDDRVSSLQQQRKVLAVQLADLLALPTASIPESVEWSGPQSADFSVDALLLALEANNPELAMLERRVESADARRELARLASYPDITLGLNYIQIGEPDNGASMADAGRDAWGVTVGVSIPLWWNSNRAARTEALLQKRAAERDLEQRRNALRADLQSAVARLEDAQRRVHLYGEELLALAEQAAENSRSGYESGKTSILEMIDSERSLLDLQTAYWRAAADANQQRVIIQTLTNEPLTGFSPAK